MSSTRIYISLLLLLNLGNQAFAQNPKRQPVNGTQCTMIPPTGFVASPSFSGFMHKETSSSIMIIEIPISPDSLVGGFTKEALEGKGMKLIKLELIEYQGKPATYLSATQFAYGQTFVKQILLFGDSSSTVMVNGIYPQKAKKLASVVKKTLFTTEIDKKILLQPEESAPYAVDVSGSDFKFPSYMTGSLSYSTTDAKSATKPILVIANSLGSVFYLNEKTFAEKRVNEMPGNADLIIDSTRAIEIANMDGYEIVAHAKDKNGNPKLTYTVMLFDDDNHYFIIHGEAQEQLDDYLLLFKKIAKSFRLKRAVY